MLARILIAVSLIAALGACTPSTSLRTRDRPQSVPIAVCQTFCIDGDIEGNLRRIEYALERAAGSGAAVACFPETCLLGWVNPQAHELAAPIPGKLSDRIAELAKKHDIMIAIGLCEKDGDALHDSAILISREGEILLEHRKINILGEPMDPPYAPGSIDDVKAVDTPIGRVGMLICADTFRDEIVAAMAKQKPDLLIVPYGWAADAGQWPAHGKRLAAWVKSTSRRAGCPVVGTDLVGAISSGPWKGKTYGGQSVVVDAKGNVLGVLRDRDADLRIFEITIRSR